MPEITWISTVFKICTDCSHGCGRPSMHAVWLLQTYSYMVKTDQWQNQSNSALVFGRQFIKS